MTPHLPSHLPAHLPSNPGSRPEVPSVRRASISIGRSGEGFRSGALLGLVIGLVLAAVGLGVGTESVSAARLIHVAPNGNDADAGSIDTPLRTIERAVQVARAGDTIEIAGGTYHESVQVYAKQVHLRAAAGAEVVLDGSVVVDGWRRGGESWSASWTSDFERVAAPFTTSDRPEAGWPEQFFLDGQPLVEVPNRNAVVPGTFFHDRDADEVVIADDPTQRELRGSDLNWAIYLNLADGSSLTDVTVQRYATQTRNMAAIRAYGNDIELRRLVVRDNARIGLSAMGDRITIGDVTAIDNGHLGVHAHRASSLRMHDLVVRTNNREGFDAKHSAGGIKITDSAGVVVERSEVTDNGGPGIWTDLDVTDAIITSNAVSGNSRSGIQVELSNDVIVFDNVVTSNGEAGVWVLESSDVDVWHNSVFSNVRDVWVETGDRRDLARVDIVNNLLGGGAEGAQAILNVDDWTERRSAVSMVVTVESNRYWLNPSSPTALVSRWANWPDSLSLSPDIAAHRTATGQATTSDLVVSDTNPLVRSAADARGVNGAEPGMEVPSIITDRLGLAVAISPAGRISAMGSHGPSSSAAVSGSTAASSTDADGSEPVSTTVAPPAPIVVAVSGAENLPTPATTATVDPTVTSSGPDRPVDLTNTSSAGVGGSARGSLVGATRGGRNDTSTRVEVQQLPHPPTATDATGTPSTSKTSDSVETAPPATSTSSDSARIGRAGWPSMRETFTDLISDAQSTPPSD